MIYACFTGRLSIIWTWITKSLYRLYILIIIILVGATFLSFCLIKHSSTLSESYEPYKIVVTLQNITPSSSGFLTFTFAFSNGDKKCIIESVTLDTPARDIMSKYNVTNKDNENNTVNAFYIISGQSKSHELPKVLNPNDLWIYKHRDRFVAQTFLKKYHLTDITQIPIGVEVTITDNLGHVRDGKIFPCAEIGFDKSKNINRIEIMSKNMELVLSTQTAESYIFGDSGTQNKTGQ